MKLVIVESPAKAKKIRAFLGEDWRVEACLGHVRDLPETQLGVEVNHDFRPKYEVLKGKGNLVQRLVKAIREAEAVYVATDPDREGEAIAWHLLELAQSSIGVSKPVYRATFTSITESAVKAAIQSPRALDMNLVEAQQTRRIIDRLVGYLVSPLASKALDKSLSAGRVQSVGLRLVVERERAIAAFQPEISWALAVRLQAGEAAFDADLYMSTADGRPRERVRFPTREPVDRLAGLLKSAHFWVEQVGQTTRTRNPFPPFTTSRLQQAAASALGLSPERTMALAQILYEAGWITYHRTDGVSVAPEAQSAAREFIAGDYGADYLPSEPPTYTARTVNAEEAHEAIRPVEVNRPPQDTNGEGAALYALIWKRFVASQMAPVRYSAIGAVIHAGRPSSPPNTAQQSYPLEFRAQGQALLFDGFLRVYREPVDDSEPVEDTGTALPELKQGQALTLVQPLPQELNTRAPARYSEGALVQALEARGIGRPSTYAAVIQIIQDRGYVRLAEKRLVPTETGIALSDYLMAYFAGVFAYDYTARLEDQLDQVAAGEVSRSGVLRAFWADFQPMLGAAGEAVLSQQKRQPGPTGSRATASKPIVLHPFVEE